MNILIAGGSGFLGRELAQQALAAGHAVTATFATRAGDVPGIHWLPLDLRRSEEITAALRGTQPDVVLNAAYRKADWSTTADGAICLAMAATQHGCRLVHMSSNAIFSGADVHYDDSLDASLLTGRRAGTDSPGALDVRLDSTRTQRTLRTTLRGARDFLCRER